MTVTTTATVRAFLLGDLRDELHAAGLSPGDVRDDTDLLDAGVIDSMRIIQLIAMVESEYELETDWDDYEPEDILVVGPFCDYVARHARTADR